MFDLFLAPEIAGGAAPAIVSSEAEELPRAVHRMISAAMNTQDPVQLDAVTRSAKIAYPQHAEEIDAIVEDLKLPVEPLRIQPVVVPAPQPARFERVDFWEDRNGEISLSAAETKGNSDTLFLGLQGKLNLKRRSQIHRLETYANMAEANGIDSQNNWGASYQLDTLWTDAYFGYVRGSFARDDFAGFKTDAFAGVGAGAYLIQGAAMTLRSEFGPGYRFLDIAKKDGTAGSIGVYGAAEFDWLIDEDWTLELDTKVNFSGPTSTVHPTLRMNTDVSDHVQAGLSYDVRYESNPPLKSESLDRILRFNVKYKY
ncbi:DUF481 domain-containing protein [Henriciella barbarensis]|uniref:DUF481 domain-containing protein n=1 Tax=Henriciella barbarensis TaxID=86342 RepID=A0A399QYY0_9PROT|nr:DUF481 domain-containing protein [Henriciella barbarensis]RIJ24336.1 DUF481 domain-containing protein [Henriciella barbarensis]